MRNPSRWLDVRCVHQQRCSFKGETATYACCRSHHVANHALWRMGALDEMMVRIYETPLDDYCLLQSPSHQYTGVSFRSTTSSVTLRPSCITIVLSSSFSLPLACAFAHLYPTEQFII